MSTREEDQAAAAALREAVEQFDAERGGKPGGRRGSRSVGRALMGVAAIGAVGVMGYYVVSNERQGDEPLGTSEPAAFQNGGDGFGDLSFEQTGTADPGPAVEATVVNEGDAAPVPAVEPAAVATGPSAAEQALLDLVEELRGELAAARDAEGEEPAVAEVDDGRLDALEGQLAELSDEAERLRAEADEAESDAALAAQQAAAQIAGLETELRLARLGGGAAVSPGASAVVPATTTETVVMTEDGTATRIVELGEGQGDESEADAARRAELERRRQEEADFLQARIRSPLVAVGGGGASAEGEEDGGGDDEEETGDFVRDGAEPAPVQQAVVIANPGRTVIQGTVIQAALETAIDSSLPGPISALVSEDVHSYDGTRILIPRGSKLIGRYDSGLETTQRRLVIAWDRIITPDNQSLTLAAYGADQLGRSGTEGLLDRRLGTRFGSAVLVSLITALPAAAGASVDDPALADVTGEVGDSLSDQGSDALDAYLTVPPTIYVDQGARITVIVDRDLELL